MRGKKLTYIYYKGVVLKTVLLAGAQLEGTYRQIVIS